ncbi:MAG: hypothetical protein ACTSVV_07980 [Promethearchaeota archaeon]
MPRLRNKTQYEILQDVRYFDDITTLQIIMAIHRQSGACFAKVYYNQGEGIKENFISGFLTAFSSFESVICEQLGIEPGNRSFKAIQYGDFAISIIDGNLLRISLISNDTIGSIMRDKCLSLLNKYEKKHKHDLENFTGDMDIFDDFGKFVEKELDVKLNLKSVINKNSLDKYDGPKSVKKVLQHMYDMKDAFFPAKLPAILAREAKLSDTMAKFYTYDAYLWYIFDPVK